MKQQILYRKQELSSSWDERPWPQ